MLSVVRAFFEHACHLPSTPRVCVMCFQQLVPVCFYLVSSRCELYALPKKFYHLSIVALNFYFTMCPAF